ncbi:MAG TPA: non-ribosomal peptide synthetase, partial [Erysipelotrichaceae bacterium]|nr:non-ribosomal peptide synthetase [Erysipelotrichaceae bacterium]
IFGEHQLTYNDLNTKSNSLAHLLRNAGVRSDDCVAIIAQKSLEIVMGMMGIVKAGGAYVPIDLGYPEDRIQFMIDDCMPKVILVYEAEEAEDLIRKDNPEIPIIDLAKSEVWNGDADNLDSTVNSSNAVYCIYTSGTTGKPKGVVVEHHNIVKLVKNCDYTPLSEKSIILQTGQMMFDASTFEVWGTFLNGGRLHLINNEMMLDSKVFKGYLKNNDINTLFITTALFNQFMNEDPTTFNSLKHLMVGGETLSEQHMDMLKRQKLDLDFRNVYGPTETTTFATHYIIDKDVVKTPIGRPISNTQIYIFDHENMCGIGVPGELCVAGDGVARGYLNRDDLTKEKFVDNPFGKGKMYRSGDLARWLADGNIEYLGRIDEQVKIRGFRIELGEIESRIREIGNVKNCAVIVREDTLGDKALYAYIVGEKKLDFSEIKDQLSINLPEYMIPAYMMQIDQIPLTKNGKLDRRALPDIVAMRKEYAPPKNSEEEALCRAFETMLGVEKVGVLDSFFELGGDSIKAIRVVSHMRSEGYGVTVKEIMKRETPEGIAPYLDKTIDESYEQGEVNGKVFLTPIMREFLSWNLKRPEHFNQAIILNLTSDIDSDIIRDVLGALVKHHDILRAVYKHDALHILPYEESKKFELTEFNVKGKKDSKKIVYEECTKIQKSMDLLKGPLVKAGLFDTDDGKYLMICIHHFAVDGVSWRILREDIETAIDCRKFHKTICFPKKTAS